MNAKPAKPAKMLPLDYSNSPYPQPHTHFGGWPCETLSLDSADGAKSTVPGKTLVHKRGNTVLPEGNCQMMMVVVVVYGDH
jgi:hypothetical protein